jgi:hypothetical protein
VRALLPPPPPPPPPLTMMARRFLQVELSCDQDTAS